MRLTELLKTDQVTISCELFPPKQGAQLANYKNIVADMASMKPAYMSVTYGATGGTSDYTVELASEVEKHQIPALAHLTCASSTKEKVASVIEELKEKQISNILALRGDIPQNADFPLPNQYRHASELIADIKAQGDFCIGDARAAGDMERLAAANKAKYFEVLPFCNETDEVQFVGISAKTEREKMGCISEFIADMLSAARQSELCTLGLMPMNPAAEKKFEQSFLTEAYGLLSESILNLPNAFTGAAARRAAF